MTRLLSLSKRVFALSVGLLVFFACHISSTPETEETFTFPTLKDKIAGADHVNITLKDTLGNVIDVLYNGPVDSTTSFKNLSAKNYHGGKVIIDIEAKKGLVVIYSVERGYDASKGGNQGQVVLIAPNMAVDFKSLSLRIREGDVVALPEVVILPADLGNKGLQWISRAPYILEVAGQTLKALLPGRATLVVRLSTDSTRGDSLEVEVFSRTDPVKPIEALHLSPDTLLLALKGPDGRFTVRPSPSTASPAATWASLSPTLFSVDSIGLLKPLAEGLGRVLAVSKLDAAVSDTAFVLVLPPQKVDSIRFAKASTDLFVGGAAESLAVTVHPPLANPAVILSAENPSLIEVSGLSIRGLKEGETRLFARSFEDPTKADTLAVVLFPAERVDSVRLKQDSIKLYVRGESQSLSATIHPSTLQPRFQWRSADTKVVAVDAQGRLSPGTAGKAFVSVTARADAEKRDSAIVIVKRDMPRLQVGQDTIVSAGITLTHRPAVTQEYGLVVMFKWDLNGDGAFEDSSTTVPATLAFLYGEVKDYRAAFYVRDTEGNDTTYYRQVKTVTGRVVQITSPKDGSYTNQSPIPVSWIVDGQPLSNTQALNPGANTVTREARDSAGKVFAHTITVHLDQTPPNRPTVKTSTLPINTLTPGWTWVSGGGGGNATYRYRLDNPDLAAATVTTDTFFTAPTNLTEGSHTLYVQERDEAGNWSASGSTQVRIDTTAPSAPTVSATPTGQTNETRPTWSWTGGVGDGHRYYRYKFGNDDFRSGGRDTTGTSFRPPAALAEGAHALFVQVRDSAGNWSASGSATVTIDTQGPPAPAVSVAATLTNDPTPTWTWTTATSGTVTFRHKLDANLEVGATVTTEKSFTPSSSLAEGSHILYVQERDAAGNWSPSGSRQVRIDVTPPSPPRIDSTPYSPLNSLRPRMTWRSGSSGARIYRARIDSSVLAGAAELIDSAYVPGGNQNEGLHGLYVQERDSAGNWSDISVRTFNIRITKRLGIAGISPISSGAEYFTVAIDSLGEKYAAIGSGSISPSVLKWSGSAWNTIGTFPSSHLMKWNNSFALSPFGVPYIALTDSNSKATIYRYGGTWTSVASNPILNASAGEPAIGFNQSGILHVAFRDSDRGGRTTVLRQNGFEWDTLGTRGFSTGFAIYFCMAFNRSGVPHVGYIDVGTSPTTVKVQRFESTSSEWKDVGIFPHSSYADGRISLVIDRFDSIFVALRTAGTGGAGEVFKFTGSNWNKVGSNIFGPAVGREPVIKCDRNGRRFVAYADQVSSTLRLKAFLGGQWIEIHNAIQGSSVGMDIDPVGTPNLLFSDLSAQERPSVFEIGIDP